jgi:hypothetical protein
MNSEIIIVSGLPRSGTSLMMQMLDNGGIEVVTDNIRTADTDNPRGYYEYEIVKKVKQDKSWLPAARGKAFKLVSQLLYDLPATEKYRVVFMERDLDEMLLSQEKMLQRLGRKAAPRDEMKTFFTQHLEKLYQWLKQQSNFQVMFIRYNEVVERPEASARRVSEFLGGGVDIEKMATSVDPTLYRNRKTSSEPQSEAVAGKGV